MPKNESQFLIKNLLKDKKTYFCLFQNSNNTNLFSIDCLQGINDVDKMLWLWDSQTNEILTNDLSKSLCVFNFTFSLCENSIIKKKNHWFLDEFGRILNEETGFCLVLSEKEEKIGDFPMRKINLGRCEGFVILIKIIPFYIFFNYRIMIRGKIGLNLFIQLKILRI